MSILLKRWAKLYSDPTPAEKALEPALASLGRPYRFQHPIWSLGYFPDFVLTADKVIIEVDDPGHKRKDRAEKDAERTAKLTKAGWRVVRCTNAEALHDPCGTVNRLLDEVGLPYRCVPAIPTQDKPRADGVRDRSRRQ